MSRLPLKTPCLLGNYLKVAAARAERLAVGLGGVWETSQTAAHLRSAFRVRGIMVCLRPMAAGGHTNLIGPAASLLVDWTVSPQLTSRFSWEWQLKFYSFTQRFCPTFQPDALYKKTITVSRRNELVHWCCRMIIINTIIQSSSL